MRLPPFSHELDGQSASRHERSEVAPSGESLVGLRPRALVDGKPLRPWVGYLDTAPVRDLEMHADLDVTLAELGDCLIEVLDAVHEDWLVAGEMAREQEWGGSGAKRAIATRVPKASIANTSSAPNPSVKCFRSAATSRPGR